MTVLSVKMDGSTRLDSLATLEAELARLEVRNPNLGCVVITQRWIGGWTRNDPHESVYTASWSQ